MEKDFLTVEDVARIAKVPISTVNLWVLQGLPWNTRNERVVFTKENIYDWLQAKKN